MAVLLFILAILYMFMGAFISFVWGPDAVETTGFTELGYVLAWPYMLFMYHHKEIQTVKKNIQEYIARNV